MKKHTPQELFASLSPRQKEVLRLVCQGTEYKEIAELLIVSESTVKSHMRAVYDKLDLLHQSRDDRIYKIRSLYCPMFEETPEDVPEVAIEIIDPENEPEPITPEEDELLMSDQSAMIALYQNNPSQTFPSERKGKKRRLGCIKFFGVLLILGLAAVGVIFSWEFIQEELGDILSFLPTSEVAPAVPTVGFVTSVPNVPTDKPSSSNPSGKTYEIGEWHKEDGVWIRLADYEVSRDLIRLDFEIWNKTGKDIYFSWSPEQNFSMVDNKNNRYEVFTASTRKVTVANDERLIFTGHGYSTVQFEDDPLYNPGVTDLFVTMEYLSEIDKATFHISVGN